MCPTGQNMAEATQYQAKLDTVLSGLEDTLAINGQLLARDPDNHAWLHQRVVTLNSIGDVFLDKKDQQRALETFQDCRTISEKLIAEQPGNRDCLDSLAQTYDRLGGIFSEQGERQRALEAYEHRLALLKDRVTKEPDNKILQQDLAATCNKIAHRILADGAFARAARLIQASIDISKHLIVREPGEAGLLFDLSRYKTSMARLELERRADAKALALYEEALNLQRQLVDKDPDGDEWLRELAQTWLITSSMHSEAGRHDEASGRLNNCLAIRKLLAEQSPADVDRQCDLAATYSHIGVVYWRREALPKAAEKLKKALAILQPLAERHRLQADGLQMLATCYEDVSLVTAQSGNVRTAADMLVKSVAIHERLAVRDGQPGWQQRIADSYQQMAGYLLADGAYDDALQAVRRGAALQQWLIDQDPDNDACCQDLLNGYEKAAKALNDAGKRSLAARLIDEARASFAELSQRHPKAAGLKWAITTLDNELVDVRRDQANKRALQPALKAFEAAATFTNEGRHDDAVEAYIAGLILLEKIAAERSAWGDLLAFMLAGHAGLCAAAGAAADQARAKTSAKAGLALAKRLAGLGPLTASDRKAVSLMQSVLKPPCQQPTEPVINVRPQSMVERSTIDTQPEPSGERSEPSDGRSERPDTQPDQATSRRAGLAATPRRRRPTKRHAEMRADAEPDEMTMRIEGEISSWRDRAVELGRKWWSRTGSNR